MAGALEVASAGISHFVQAPAKSKVLMTPAALQGWL